MADKTEVTITNGHRYAIHTVGRRFRPGRPRTLRLRERQLRVIRNNPWLWIAGEDEPIEAPEIEETPVIHTGGGWYEFADGERIKGKNNLPEGAVIVDEFPEPDEEEED